MGLSIALSAVLESQVVHFKPFWMEEGGQGMSLSQLVAQQVALVPTEPAQGSWLAGGMLGGTALACQALVCWGGKHL